MNSEMPNQAQLRSVPTDVAVTAGPKACPEEVQAFDSEAGNADEERTRAIGRLLARNTAWNLVGFATPLLVALLVIPILIRALGTSGYGILTLAWGVVGYFGIFDMGLSDALTKLIAERIGKDDHEEIESLLHTGFLLLLVSSVVASALLAVCSRTLAYSWLNVPPELRADTKTVFRIFAMALPFVVSVACFRGALAAYQRFDLINKVQIAVGVFSFLGPTAVLPFSHSLIPIVGVLAISRMLAWAAYLFLCLQVVPDLTWQRPRFRKHALKSLVTFGGWISISNVTEPVFLYSDRVMLGAMASMSAVAYYATPFDMVVRLWMIPDALNTAFFPAYAASLRSDGRHAMLLLERAGNYLFPAILAPVLLVVLFSKQILMIWVGANFAQHSAPVLGWLAVGVFLSSIARIPWTLLISHRPDLPAKLVLFEAPLYLSVLYLMIRFLGLEGAAIAWALRTGFNCCLLHAITWRILPGSHRAVAKNAVLVLMGVLVFAVAMLLPQILTTRGLYFVAAYCMVIAFSWFCILSPEERAEMAPASYFS